MYTAHNAFADFATLQTIQKTQLSTVHGPAPYVIQHPVRRSTVLQPAPVAIMSSDQSEKGDSVRLVLIPDAAPIARGTVLSTNSEYDAVDLASDGLVYVTNTIDNAVHGYVLCGTISYGALLHIA